MNMQERIEMLVKAQAEFVDGMIAMRKVAFATRRTEMWSSTLETVQQAEYAAVEILTNLHALQAETLAMAEDLNAIIEELFAELARVAAAGKGW